MGTPGCRLYERESQTLDLHAGSAVDAPISPSRREPDVEIVYERVAGIDVGKKILAVAVRTPGEHPGKRRQQVRKYNTFYQTLTEMVAWLVAEGVTHVTMEATGIYWKPIVRHEAPGIEWRCNDFTAGQSQLAGEAGGSRGVGTHATVGAALTTYGTGRHCQTIRVRQAVMRRRTRGTAVRRSVRPVPAQT